jgi:phenylacetaldehyde dehydrogenase
MKVALMHSVVAFLARDHSNFIDCAVHISESEHSIALVDPTGLKRASIFGTLQLP